MYNYFLKCNSTELEGIEKGLENDCLVEFSLEVHEAIQLLYEQWVAKCEPVVAWAWKQNKAGFEVAFLADLSECLARAKEWLRVQNELRENTMSHEELTAYARKCGNSLVK